MQKAWSAFQDWGGAFLRNAAEPLRHLTWETGALLIGIAGLAALATAWVLRVSWRWRKPSLAAVKIKPHHHTYVDHLRLAPSDYLRFHKLAADLKMTSPPFLRKLRGDASRYYVITIVEATRKVVVLYKEMRLNVPNGTRWRPQPGVIQLDQDGVSEVRLHNGHEEDDDPNAGVIVGDYDVYIRPVRWFDVRHWLTHPNREIRIVVWVTIITTSVPLLIEVIGSAVG